MQSHSAIDGILENLQQTQRPLVVVLGPTASGKTAFSVDAALHIERELQRTVEIVNADSRQLYRFLDIGTAKITEEEKRGARHHLLDCFDPDEEVTAAMYKEMTTQTIDAIHERGNIPFLVGGSMLYISAIIDGLEFAPPSSLALRGKLEKEYDQDGGKSSYARLQEIDPETASTIHQNNKPYVIRALEIYEATNEPASSQKSSQSCPYDLTIIGMEWPREALYERINERTKHMFENGWMDEVRDLIAQGYSVDNPAMKSHGYREIMEAIQSGEEIDQEELIELIATRSRQYAKRQMTWWRRDERIRWVTPSLLPQH